MPERKTTIDYHKTIHQPITQYETVPRTIAAVRGSHKNTFDLGFCMKALPLIWTFPDEFKKHVVILGPFNTEINFIGTLTNHKMQGSGYVEIIVTKSCIKNVLNGKAFTKALVSLKAVNGALERLLLEVFREEENSKIYPTCIYLTYSLIHVVEVILMQL